MTLFNMFFLLDARIFFDDVVCDDAKVFFSWKESTEKYRLQSISRMFGVHPVSVLL